MNFSIIARFLFSDVDCVLLSRFAASLGSIFAEPSVAVFFSVVLENNYSGLSNLGGYPLDFKLLKRRAEMLDAVSTGLHPAAVIGQLAEKYGVSERCLWSDWERR